MSGESAASGGSAATAAGSDAPAGGRSKAARAGLLAGLATLSMAVASGIQALLYLRAFGAGERTDAFFAAFLLYAVFGVFAQSIRVTAVPLLVGEDRRLMRGRDFAATLALIAVPVLLACELAPGPLAQLLAPGVSDAARAATEDALRILGAAMVLQLAAAGAATLLAVWDRFEAVFGAYVSGAATGLITFFVVRPSADELTLGWSMLAMAVVTFAWMVVALERNRTVRRPGLPAPPRRLAVNAGVILASTIVSFVFNGLFMITMAVASRATAGDVTVLSYAYLFVSYLVAFTGTSVGISRVNEMAVGAQDDWREVVADTVPHGFRYALLVCLPAIAGLVAAGATVVSEVLPDSLPGEDAATLRALAALLAPWLVGALLVNLLLPSLFALDRARFVNLIALPMIVLHLAATLAGEALWGLEGTVGAAFVAPLAYGLALLAVGAGPLSRRVMIEMGADLVRFGVLAAAAFGAGALIAAALGGGLPGALVAALVGGVLYVAAVRFLAPRQFGVLVGRSA